MLSTARAAAEGGVVVSSVRSTAASMSSWVILRAGLRVLCQALATSKAANSTTMVHRATSWRLNAREFGGVAAAVAAFVAGESSAGGAVEATASVASTAAGVRLRTGRELL